MIRKEVYCSPAVLEELKRIIADSEVRELSASLRSRSSPSSDVFARALRAGCSATHSSSIRLLCSSEAFEEGH